MMLSNINMPIMDGLALVAANSLIVEIAGQ
jgi:hypothetical protein